MAYYTRWLDKLICFISVNEKEEVEKPEEVTESPTVSRSSLVPGFTMPNNEDADENYIPDLCMANYDTLQVLQGKIFVFEEEVR